VPRGSVFALLGRNGSGKSTLVRMVLGLLEPTRGSARIFGHDSRDLPPHVRRRIGYMPENHPVYPWMRISHFADFQRGSFGKWNAQIFNAIADYFSIDVRGRPGRLSRGQRAGLSLALTLATEPELLVLDDPAMGLDPVARRALLEAMVHFTRDQDRTIFFSSHQLDDVERVADHIAIMDQSVLRACCSAQTFSDRVRQFVLDYASSSPAIPPIPRLVQASRSDTQLTLIIANPDEETDRVLATMGADSIEQRPISLEESLIAFVGRRGEKVSFLRSLGGLT
jgi:ABC-2 type transport system ATP-binding protein